MATSIRPLHDRLLIKRLDEQEQVRGGIIIPDTAKEKPQQGEVIAAGSGKFREDGTRQPLDGSRATACYSGSTAARKQKLMMRNIYRVSYFLRVFCFPWRFGGSRF